MAQLDEIQRVPEFPLHYRIRLACEMAGVEADDLAEALDVHPNTAHNYLSGRSKPKRPALKEIAERCRVSLQWLETGESPFRDTITGRYYDEPTLFDEELQVSAGIWHPSYAVAA